MNNLCMGGLSIQLPYRTCFAWRESNIGMYLMPMRRFEDTTHHVTSRMSQTIIAKQQSVLELRHRAGHSVGFYAANGCDVQPTRQTFQLLMNMLLAIFVRSDTKKFRTMIFSGFKMIFIISNISKTQQRSSGT